MKRFLPLSVVLFSGALSACSSDDSSSGLALPAVSDIVSEAKPAALDSASGLLVRQVRSTRDVSLFTTCSYGATADILACLAGNVLTDPAPTSGNVGEQLFHWLENFDKEMGELETRFADVSPDCASADPVSVDLSLAGYSATLQLQCRDQSDLTTKAFGVDADGKTYLVDFSHPDATSAEDIATVAVVSADGNQVDAWVLLNNVESPYLPTVQRISASRTGGFNYETRSVTNSSNSFEHLKLIGTSTYVSGSGAQGDTGSSFTDFCVNPSTREDLDPSECASAVFPTTDLTGDGTVAITDLDTSGVATSTTAAISALVDTDLTAIPSVQ